ncbi:MAG: CotH kinase family protein [Clostridia bacterium]|nr:CotH kinase family protein [Clostridia bacterium]
MWLVKDSVYCFGEYNVQFNSENISDSVVAISYFDTTLSDKSCGNLIREFKIYNDNENVLNMNAEEVYENNKTLLSDMNSKGYATLPSANSATATVKEGIWNSTESSKKIEIGSYNSTKNAYGLVSLSSINASDGEQFVLGANLYQTITTPADCESIKITFDGRRALTSNSSKNRLFVTNSTNIPSEDPDTEKTQFDYLTENSYFNNNCKNDGLTVIYTAKFAENGKFSVDINEAVSLEEDEIHTEKIYVYTYENSTNTKWEKHGLEILNTSKETEENLILYFNSTTYEGVNNLLDNVQVSTGDFSMFEGDGTEQSPYLISDEEDFINFRELGMLATNIYFKQTDNITLTQPLEVGSTVSFYGIYDGDGYYISNLNASDSSSKGEITLFHYLYGTVKNLGLKDVNYTSKFCASAIANYLYGTIENCWITGNISGDVYAAGIATGIGNYGQIKNSYFVGTVTSTNNFGAAAYRPGSTPTFVNVFSTTDVCISSKLASSVTPTITNCAIKTEEEMKTQEFLDTLNQYVNENTGLTKWVFDENTGLPVFRQANIIPEITSLSANVNNENANILWMYDANTKEYNLYLPKLADRNNLIINVDYSVQSKEALVYDENNTKLGILKSGEANNYFTNDKVILKFDDENTKTYTINVLQSTLPSVFLNIDGGDASLNEINADKNHNIGYSGTAVITDSSNSTKTATFKKMKGRGNYTWTYSKRPYQVSFDEKISMLGMPKSKKWLFITNYTDGSLTRSAIFYKLAQELGIQYAITFETADVYINGKYNGTYLVTSKVESGSNRVDIDDDDYLLEIDNYTDPIQFKTEKTNKSITIKSPDLEEATAEEQQAVINSAKAYIDSIESLIYDENVTFEELSNKIDMESFAKCYWIYEISLNYDAMYGSSYMYTKDGLLHMGPMWDYDNTLNLLTKNAISLNSYYLLGNTGGAASKRLRWYNELMRYQEFSDLVDKVFLENVDKFDDLIEYAKQYNQNIAASAKMNYTRWPYETMKQEHPSWYMGGNSFEESSQNLINDIETRVNFYKNEYKDLNINEIKYETIGVNGQKVEGSITLDGTSKIELPNTISLDAEVKLTGISDNNVERDMGTVNLTEGRYTGSIAVSNKINVELDKKYNIGVYSIEIQRLNSEIKSIEITKLPIKTEYIEGEKIDITGMVVTATYSDDTTSETTDYEINLKDELKISDEKVIVTYGGKSAEFEIIVKENAVTKLEITKQPTKIEYIEGQNFDATGMVIKGTLLDGTEKEITDYTIENGNGLSKNIIEVEIKYGKLSAYVPITVKENIVTKIEITKQPDKTQYFVGESFDQTGMIVTATFLDGTEKEITNYQITKTDALGIKDKIITIECDGMTADVAITVKEIVYTVLEGENRKFIKNYDKDLSIKIDADVTLFQKVFIDDEEIDKSNYVITSGSTIVTLKQSYLNQLSVGTHTMKTVFTDGGVAYSTITIIEDADKNNLDKEDTNLEKNTNITSSTPKTGDTILTFVTMFIISVLGIVSTLKYKKNQRSGKH